MVIFKLQCATLSGTILINIFARYKSSDAMFFFFKKKGGVRMKNNDFLRRVNDFRGIFLKTLRVTSEFFQVSTRIERFRKVKSRIKQATNRYLENARRGIL